jgi:transcriptional regulator with XRE-family HTH domain
MSSKQYRDSYVSAHVSNTIAAQISALRESHGWTQKQLAQKAGMTQSRISALEDPNYENPEVGTLRRIASAFDVALTVRFIPFSELATWTAGLSSDHLEIPDFAHDDIVVQAPPKITTRVDIVTFAAGAIGGSGTIFGSSLVGGGAPRTASGSWSFISIVDTPSAQQYLPPSTRQSASFTTSGDQ